MSLEELQRFVQGLEEDKVTVGHLPRGLEPASLQIPQCQAATRAPLRLRGPGRALKQPAASCSAHSPKSAGCALTAAGSLQNSWLGSPKASSPVFCLSVMVENGENALLQCDKSSQQEGGNVLQRSGLNHSVKKLQGIRPIPKVSLSDCHTTFAPTVARASQTKQILTPTQLRAAAPVSWRWRQQWKRQAGVCEQHQLRGSQSGNLNRALKVGCSSLAARSAPAAWHLRGTAVQQSAHKGAFIHNRKKFNLC